MNYFESLKALSEEEFYKRFPGAFQDRLLRPEMCDMFYLWNINYDGSLILDKGNEIKNIYSGSIII